ncbi:MAG: hypothetical protein DRO87_10805 [Candidatus Thorarchaeota archaeon]|nr:MAG: hypothetical protein DRO87_10805 [Candidatus Thorarchaeota archaeon]
MTSEMRASESAVALQSAAGRAWARAVSDFYHPPLPDPVIEYSTQTSSFFYIDSSTWTVHVNTAGVPLHLDSSEAESYLTSVCHHEIQHYLLCPFDGVTSGLMFSAARKHVNDDAAMFVCNLYADLVVDTSLLRRFPNLTHDRIAASIHESSLRAGNHSELWRLIVACHRAMWGFPVPPMVSVEGRTFEVAREIADIARKSMSNESRWPRACDRIARLLAELMSPEDIRFISDSGEGKVASRGDSGVDDTEATVPADVDAIMGSPLEVRNGDLAKRCIEGLGVPNIEDEMERLARDVNNRGGSLEDLEAVYALAGIGQPDADWIRFWYRAKAREMVRFDIRTTRRAGSIPLATQLWRLGDPIEDLDIVQSLQAFPVLVPNMSTRKWQRFIPQGTDAEDSLPDLLLVIDSSGSMTWAMRRNRVSGPYHTALVSAFAAIDFALRRGARVSVINFSDGTRTCEWTTSRASAERVLLQYQGGGTVAPTARIREACKAADNPVLALIITDAYVANWKKLVDTVRALVRNGHRMVFFHIGGGTGAQESRTQKDLGAAGASVYPVKSVKDLPGLVVREARRTYN